MTATLSENIRQFYDASSLLWEGVWGEHMHHGFYGLEGKRTTERRQAQIDLIEELLQWGQVQEAQQILDVGCGIGGSTLYLAEKFQASVTGITLSPVQAGRATERAEEANLPATFKVADALHMPFDDESFDLVWTLESGEHMPEKPKFLQECYRVLKPGGTLLMATWCHRSIEAKPLEPQEQALLNKIYKVYHLPYIVSLPEYAAIATQLPLKNVRTTDWSDAVAPFWGEVIRSSLNPKVIWGILKAGWGTLQGALAMRYMSQGYRRGIVRFGLLCGTKE
ncbi:2-methyl-6-phytyl-1,4-hydroquinone methyltransferase [Acaryochloris thomasi RCC1774]|uniref:2-methyl-6-phytyl-1,4-hydroquinone methyltransferase n=1 Tax=Acaryochloris thomasi RCC1774 TaxID=1764569 RepID=A0A2W1JJX6_9CYAN|nr:methyltransferase domain-containing protein [Acaryochloris thomasi]PZD73536.1 2-methyl-6-phytyl-1,4-hydroquinone methyltransferase [Acaryochloris thomasi RCC1774]